MKNTKTGHSFGRQAGKQSSDLADRRQQLFDSASRETRSMTFQLAASAGQRVNDHWLGQPVSDCEATSAQVVDKSMAKHQSAAREAC